MILCYLLGIHTRLNEAVIIFVQSNVQPWLGRMYTWGTVISFVHLRRNNYYLEVHILAGNGNATLQIIIQVHCFITDDTCSHVKINSVGQQYKKHVDSLLYLFYFTYRRVFNWITWLTIICAPCFETYYSHEYWALTLTKSSDYRHVVYFADNVGLF